MIFSHSQIPLFTRLVLKVLYLGVPTLFSFRKVHFDLLQALTKAPVVVGNHGTNWDPIWIIAGVNQRIRYLASDLVFRRPVLGRLLRWLGMIPKRKFHADPKSVRSMREALARGEWVGFYPEGEATWTGSLSPFVEGTGKLLKFLGAPVVCIRTEGAYFAQARWLRTRKIRPITMVLSCIITPEELKSLTPSEIEEILRQSLEIYPWESTPYTQMTLEGLEGALAFCPACRASHSLESQSYQLSCSHCKAQARLGGKGALTWTLTPGQREPSTPLPSSVPEWFWAQDQWLVNQGFRVWDQLLMAGNFEEHSPRLGRKFRVPVKITWTQGGQVLEIRETSGKTRAWSFPMVELEWVNVQMGERIEFRFQNRIYILHLRKPLGGYPFYRWHKLYQKGRK